MESDDTTHDAETMDSTAATTRTNITQSQWDERLWDAAGRDDLVSMREALQNGANASTAGIVPFINACYHGRMGAILFLSKIPGIDLNASNGIGLSGFLWACHRCISKWFAFSLLCLVSILPWQTTKATLAFTLPLVQKIMVQRILLWFSSSFLLISGLMWKHEITRVGRLCILLESIIDWILWNTFWLKAMRTYMVGIDT